MTTLQVPGRVYCADVEYQYAVVSTAGRQLTLFNFESNPPQQKTLSSSLKYEHRCISIFKDKKGDPSGFAVGSIGGYCAIQYFNPSATRTQVRYKSFKCVVFRLDSTRLFF